MNYQASPARSTVQLYDDTQTLLFTHSWISGSSGNAWKFYWYTTSTGTADIYVDGISIASNGSLDYECLYLWAVTTATIYMDVGYFNNAV